MSVRFPLRAAGIELENAGPRHLSRSGTGVGSEVIIRLKWGQTEYKGTLESIDSYMNVLLRDTEEFIDGKQTGSLGLVLIRYDTPVSLSLADGMSS
ncbi:small nuclear ribonucleoprotein SmF [Penicillium capsulatum]|nr:small nuclear ribonucleoprotein SmF [Penicillium capsulatum]